MKVVCIKSHSDPDSGVKKGMEFTLLNIDVCRCGDESYDIGVSIDANEWSMDCPVCGDTTHDGIWWMDPKLFATVRYKSDEFISSDKIEKSAEERIDIKLPVSA